ncbi:MAG: exo-alpha-sialidase [Planctomycetes bacterium]|nr:exo-alpha-sialidase [Planctomycetota bacterium]
MNRIPVACLIVPLLPIVAAVAGPPEERDHASRQAHGPGERDTLPSVIRVAGSDDGLSFSDSGKVFLGNAAAPALIQLPNGHLIAVFDYLRGPPGKQTVVMGVSRSTDRGKSWSRPMPLRLSSQRGGPIRGRHGELVPLAEGWFRLYFTADSEPARDPGERQSEGAVVIRSAVTRDGMRYHLDDSVHARLTDGVDVHSTGVVIEGRVHLFATMMSDARSSQGVESLTRHLVSDDGRRFRPVAHESPANVDFIGSIVQIGERLRAYVSDSRGIRSLVSENGIDWTLEADVGLAGGSDPAVILMADGGYLMLYVDDGRSASDGKSDASPELVVADDSQTGGWDLVEIDVETSPGVDPDRADADEGAEASQSDLLIALTSGEQSEQSVALIISLLTPTGSIPGDESESTEASGDLAPTVPASASDRPVEFDEALGVPLPNFEMRVDYVAWYREHSGMPSDNAYSFYGEIIPDFFDEWEWPTPRNMYYDKSYEAPPGPWNPADHPEWEASFHEYEALRRLYAEAARHEGYANPITFSPEAEADSEDGRPLLIEMLLPSLRGHRHMAKVNLADSWRTDEEGHVSSERMLEAWETTLRSANHLNQGTTLIEHLVAVAEQGLVQSNARWALSHGVFSDDELEAALDTLLEFDRGVDDPTRWVQGEYAAAMDALQYIFTPAGADGQPQLNRKRVEAISEIAFGDMDDLLDMGPEDAWESLDVFGEHYRELADAMRTGYPEVRSEDLDRLHERNVDRTPLTRLMLPSLGRVYKLRVRNETARRATQLSYALHVFEARYGRWPESLDELPSEYGERMRTDPFTNRAFGYRVTEQGPILYSLSENGRDDGGIHSPRWDDGIDDTASDDYVFWPPQEKR